MHRELAHLKVPGFSIVFNVLLTRKLPYTTHNSSIRSDEGLTLETSAFQLQYGGQFTLSSLLINQIFVYHYPTDAAPVSLETNPFYSSNTKNFFSEVQNLVNSENKENLSNYQPLKRKPSVCSISLHFSKLITVVDLFFPETPVLHWFQ